MKAQIIATLLFLVLGIVFVCGKGTFLIAGYNTLPEEKKARYDARTILRDMSRMMFSCVGCMAVGILGSIVDRNAEWHFLMGAVAYHRGWMDEASKYFRQAASMDPGNAEYRQAVAQMECQANGPFAGGRAVGMNTLDCGAFCPCMALMATSGGCAPFICCC